MKKYVRNKAIPHVIYHNWVVNTPLETGIADRDKGRAALAKSMTYENPFGVFVTGIDRTEEPDSVVLKSRKKTFSYTGAVMTLPTGVQAVAAARYGSPEEALQYIEKLHQSFSYALPGSMYEVSPGLWDDDTGLEHLRCGSTYRQLLLWDSTKSIREKYFNFTRTYPNNGTTQLLKT